MVIPEELASEVLVAEPPIPINGPSNHEPDESVQKPAINIPSKRVSGLSISSLKAKKEHELNRKDETIDESQLPKDAFTEEQMKAHWADFVEILDKDGRKILASNLNTDIPKLKNPTTMWIELPNDTMKKEVEREQYDLMEYLRQKLNNYFISLTITVNEETAKKFAFTPLEKYEKLREKNPAIDILRKEFDLDF
jgi:DNA polymerase-3 subunit gamma/tau